MFSIYRHVLYLTLVFAVNISTAQWFFTLDTFSYQNLHAGYCSTPCVYPERFVAQILYSNWNWNAHIYHILLCVYWNPKQRSVNNEFPLILDSVWPFQQTFTLLKNKIHDFFFLRQLHFSNKVCKPIVSLMFHFLSLWWGWEKLIMLLYWSHQSTHLDQLYDINSPSVFHKSFTKIILFSKIYFRNIGLFSIWIEA